MAGHSKWKNIKQRKDKVDKERGKLFSKLSKNISIAARGNPDPQFNAALRSAIDQAKKANMPQANIERAIKKASGADAIEELLVEAYGPEGIGILVQAATDNTNRTMGEIKLILKNHEAKLAEPGSLSWAFEKTTEGFEAKFSNPASEDSVKKVDRLIEALEENDDVQEVYSSLKR